MLYICILKKFSKTLYNRKNYGKSHIKRNHKVSLRILKEREKRIEIQEEIRKKDIEYEYIYIDGKCFRKKK